MATSTLTHRRCMWRRAKASILTALTLQLGLSTGFGPTAWTVPRRGCGVESLHRGGGGLGSGERRSWDRVCDRGRLHDAIAAGKRERLRTMATTADASGGGMRPEGRGPRLAGEVGSTAAGAGGDESDDHYSVLGLAVGASPAEIKDAYRQRAMQLHPDSEGANASRDKFEELTAAYEVLSDPGTRSTYDQGLALRSFVDKVKAGNWGKTLMAVASLGAVATSVGVSAGVAAAQPLAKDFARGLEDMSASGLQSAGSPEALDSLAREKQAVQKGKAEAERKLEVLRRKAELALTEASALEEAREAQLEEQAVWNATLAENQEESAETKQLLLDTRSRVAEANEAVGQRRAKEQEAMEDFRRSKAARDTFSQACKTAERKVSSAESTVAAAEERLAEALKALDGARQGLESACQQVADFEGQRTQVLGKEEAAEKTLGKAKELCAAGRAALAEQQNRQAAAQADLRAALKRESIASAKVKELGDRAEADRSRAVRLRTAAEVNYAAAKTEQDAIEAAVRQAERVEAQEVAAKAAQEAAAAAAREEKLQREREKAVAAAAAAVTRAKAAEAAAERAAESAIEAAAAARQATADAVAVADASDLRVAQLTDRMTAKPETEPRSGAEPTMKTQQREASGFRKGVEGEEASGLTPAAATVAAAAASPAAVRNSDSGVEGDKRRWLPATMAGGVGEKMKGSVGGRVAPWGSAAVRREVVASDAATPLGVGQRGGEELPLGSAIGAEVAGGSSSGTLWEPQKYSRLGVHD